MGQSAPIPSLALPRSQAFAASFARRRLTRVAIGAFGALAVVGAAAPKGGYFPTAWGWITLGLGAAAVVALALENEARLSPPEKLTVLLLGLFVGWVALSAVWSQSLPSTILEVERDVIYPVGLLAALLVVNRGGVRPLLGGALLGVTAICSYALATRLLPERLGTFDPIAGYRLSVPIGYWNGLGVFASMGVLLAIGISANARGLAARAFAAASLPILLPTLYFTFSRGAWIALGFGSAVALALDPRRLKLISWTLFVAAPAAAAVWLGSRSPALTREGATFSLAEHDGHRLLAEIVLLAICSAAIAVILGVLERSVRIGRTGERAWASVLVAGLVAAIAAGVVHYGGPVQVAKKGYHSFTGPPISVTQGQSLTNRLFTLSNSGRLPLWRVAWREYRAHPATGTGAGTFEQWWLQHRPSGSKVRNAHNLYLEVLAELGPLALALLVGALLVPLVTAVRARHHPFVGATAGAYAAFLLHAAGDWDWQLVGVTLTALICAAALLRAARTRRAAGEVHVPWRPLVAVAVVCVVAFAMVGEIGNSALASAARAANDGNWRKERSQAQRAVDWAPWSSEALRRLAEAQYSLGQGGASRRTLQRAIAQDPRDWELWLDLAVVGQGAARRDAFAHALRLDPLERELAQERSDLGLGKAP